MSLRLKTGSLRRLGQSSINSAATATLSLLICIAPSALHAQTAQTLTATSLKVGGLNYEKELMALFLGDFPNSGLEPESGTFASLFPSYVTAFARTCKAYLPSNRVEITKQECARESTPVNIYGNPVGATTCVEYRTVGTGLYADPALLAISERLQARQAGKLIGGMFNRSQDPMATTRQMTDVMLLAHNDMNQLLRANQCNSMAIKRLQDNMVRFAGGGSPLRLSSGATLASVQARAVRRDPSKPADYARLIDDLIVENSRGWTLNQYIRGSVRSVSVQGQDSGSAPSSIRARYSFSQLGKPQVGEVRVSFQQGLPKCLFFFDAPSTCRIASPRIANAFERGEY
jgi:hypothetical protein